MQASEVNWKAQSRQAGETTNEIIEERKELQRSVMGPIKALLKPLNEKITPRVPLSYDP